MTAKNEAFSLFDKGKKPEDPELQVLGVARDTIKKYYLLWRQRQPEPEPKPEVAPAIAPSEVPVGSLKIGQPFTLGGASYRVAEVTPEFVRATKLREISYDNNATMLLAIGQASLATSTLVKAE